MEKRELSQKAKLSSPFTSPSTSQPSSMLMSSGVVTTRMRVLNEFPWYGGWAQAKEICRELRAS